MKAYFIDRSEVITAQSCDYYRLRLVRRRGDRLERRQGSGYVEVSPDGVECLLAGSLPLDAIEQGRGQFLIPVDTADFGDPLLVSWLDIPDTGDSTSRSPRTVRTTSIREARSSTKPATRSTNVAAPKVFHGETPNWSTISELGVPPVRWTTGWESDRVSSSDRPARKLLVEALHLAQNADDSEDACVSIFDQAVMIRDFTLARQAIKALPQGESGAFRIGNVLRDPANWRIADSDLTAFCVTRIQEGTDEHRWTWRYGAAWCGMYLLLTGQLNAALSMWRLVAPSDELDDALVKACGLLAGRPQGMGYATTLASCINSAADKAQALASIVGESRKLDQLQSADELVFAADTWLPADSFEARAHLQLASAEVRPWRGTPPIEGWEPSTEATYVRVRANEVDTWLILGGSRADQAERWPLLISVRVDENGGWITNSAGSYEAAPWADGRYYWLFRGRVISTSSFWQLSWVKLAACRLLESDTDLVV